MQHFPIPNQRSILLLINWRTVEVCTRVKLDWESFKREIISPNTSSIQILEMKMAFFAGARAMYSFCTLDIPALSDAEAELELEKTGLELNKTPESLFGTVGNA